MQLFKPNVDKLQQKRDVPGLIKLLEDKDWNVRAAAIRALGEMGDPQAIPGLIGRLGYSNGEALKEALNRIGKPAITPLIEELTRSENNCHEIATFWPGLERRLSPL